MIDEKSFDMIDDETFARQYETQRYSTKPCTCDLSHVGKLIYSDSLESQRVRIHRILSTSALEAILRQARELEHSDSVKKRAEAATLYARAAEREHTLSALSDTINESLEHGHRGENYLFDSRDILLTI